MSSRFAFICYRLLFVVRTMLTRPSPELIWKLFWLVADGITEYIIGTVIIIFILLPQMCWIRPRVILWVMYVLSIYISFVVKLLKDNQYLLIYYSIPVIICGVHIIAFFHYDKYRQEDGFVQRIKFFKYHTNMFDFLTIVLISIGMALLFGVLIFITAVWKIVTMS